jgi:large subunit ribosomal protein L18Ae
MREYQVAGRARSEFTKPGEKAKIYRMRVFAPNPVQARSRFWYFLTKLKKVKRAHGEIVSCTEV